MECYHYQSNVTTKHCENRLPSVYDCIDPLTAEVRKTLTNEIRSPRSFQAPLVCLTERTPAYLNIHLNLPSKQQQQQQQHLHQP